MGKYLIENKFLLVDIMGMYNFLAANPFKQAVDAKYYSTVHDKFSEVLSAFDLDPNMDESGRAKVLFSHVPAGCTYRCVMHFAQLMHDESFVRYNFGTEENLKRYNQSTPPEYPLHRIPQIPIAILAGTADILTEVSDVQWLIEKLGSRVVF